MKRIISLMLVMTVLLSTGFCSAAAQATEVGSTNVTAEYVPGTQGGQTISVKIEWEGMDFTYNGASDDVWDAEKHQYIPGTAAGWAKSDAYISITNHSNVMLKAGIAYSGKSEYADMGLIFTDTNPYIGSAETKDVGEGDACTVVVRAIPTGKLPSDTPADSQVGEIRITVSPEEDQKQILTTIQGEHAFALVKSDSLSRQDICFATDAVVADINERLQQVSGIIDSDNYSPAEKNAALNGLLSVYYSERHFMQDFFEETNG